MVDTQYDCVETQHGDCSHISLSIEWMPLGDRQTISQQLICTRYIPARFRIGKEARELGNDGEGLLRSLAAFSLKWMMIIRPT